MAGYRTLVRFLLVTGIALGWLGGCATSPAMRELPPPGERHIIYVTHKDWHTNLLVESAALLPHAPQLARDFLGTRFLRIGWGDGDYYPSDNPSMGMGARALVASRYPALRVMGFTGDPRPVTPAGTIMPLAISSQGMRTLAKQLEDSIERDTHGRPTLLGTPVPGQDVYYRSKGRYSLFNTCNTWTSRSLQSAGIPISPALRLTQSSVMKQVRAISLQQAQAGAFARDPVASALTHHLSTAAAGSTP